MPDQAVASPLALIVSNQEWVARSLDSILAPAGYRVLRTTSGSEALAQADRLTPDVFLIDSALSDTTGVGLSSRLRDHPAGLAGAPIVITAQEPVSRETRLESLRAGAWEYVVFPWDAEELLLKLTVYLRAKETADRLRDESLVDPETGCYSARGLVRRAHEIGAIASRTARPMACVTLAPDPEPGAEGAGASAAVVLRLGEVFATHTRDSDSVGRIGHHEFVVLAPETDPRGALRLAERLTGAAEALLRAHGAAPPAIRAGCFGVQNFRDAALDPIEIMARSTLALRQTQAERSASRIQLYGSQPRS